jgi:cellulose synthase/poly-beta-1,6-N-acetylglucosamine synthase-like glycosyltransferase
VDRRVFIVIGLYQPDPSLLARQLDSLAAQTHRNIEVLACADGPDTSGSRDVVAGFADRMAIRYVGFETRKGVHANFARGLREALAHSDSDSDLFAFCDQDDIWHPTKLQRQVASFADPDVSLCHCDARIVSPRGDVLAPSLFEHEARAPSASFVELLIMNSVTGMTAMFRRDVAVAAQPYPMSGCRYILHDHWTALTAALLGDISFIQEPLVDYAQHASNVLGARQQKGASLLEVASLRRHAYLRKCYRQYLWRRRALQELRRALGALPQAAERLSAEPVRALFDCNASRLAGPSLSWRYRLRGNLRQADQIWRIWRARLLYCPKHTRRRQTRRP